MTQIIENTNFNNTTSWESINPDDFWKQADEIQDITLEESDKLFKNIASASPEKLRELLIQYRYFTVYYIPDLALMIARLEDGPLKSFLADILYDELGCGKAENAHPQLYDNFLVSIGVSDVDLSKLALAKNIALLDEARTELVNPANTTDYAVGLRGMGGECVCQVYIAQLHKWLMQNPYIQENKENIDWVFWDLHVGDHDIEHREQTRAMIDQEIVQKGGKRLEQLGSGYAHSMNSWRSFWINIFELESSYPCTASQPRSEVRSFVDVAILPNSTGQTAH